MLLVAALFHSQDKKIANHVFFHWFVCITIVVFFQCFLRKVNMTPEQALQVLDQVAQNVAGTRKDHETIRQAVEVLQQAIAKSEG